MNTGKKITGQLGLYLQWPLLLSIMIVVMNTVIVIIDATAGLAMLGFTVIYLIIAIFLYVYKRRASWPVWWSFRLITRGYSGNY